MKSRVLDICMALLRMCLVVVALPFFALAFLLTACGECGEWLTNALEDLNHAMRTSLRPRNWRTFQDLVSENRQLKTQADYWRDRAKELESEEEGSS